MNTKDIADEYGIDKAGFEAFLRGTNKTYSDSFWGMTVDDANVAAYVDEFCKRDSDLLRKKMAAQKAERERAEAEQKQKNAAMSQILISSGFSFDGYKIVKYSGYISGDDVTQIPRSGVFGGKNGENLTQALVKIRRQALAELKEAAYNLGCNAVVGVDFDYITLSPETANIGGGTLYEPYIICVTANGNAVIIEKLQE